MLSLLLKHVRVLSNSGPHIHFIDKIVEFQFYDSSFVCEDESTPHQGICFNLAYI